MKLLRSTFLAWSCFSTTGTTDAFISPTANLAAHRPVVSTTMATRNHNALTCQRTAPTSSTTSLYAIDLLESTGTPSAKEESEWGEYVKLAEEVSEVKSYLNWLVGEMIEPTTTAKDDADVSRKMEGGGLELLGGSVGISAAPTEEKKPEPSSVEPPLRKNLGKTVLLSGIVDKQLASSTTSFDSTLLDFLNNNSMMEDAPSNFSFSKITALVKGDTGAAKKRVVSRESRYSGLLDKLNVVAASSSEQILPTEKELEGVSSWVTHLSNGEAGEALMKMAELVKEGEGLGELKNVIVLVDGVAASSDESWKEGWDALLQASSDGGSSIQCSLLAVGELYESKVDGTFYSIGKVENGSGSASTSTENAVPKLSRKEAYRMLAHCLALGSTTNQALFACEHDATPTAEADTSSKDDVPGEIPPPEIRSLSLTDTELERRMIMAMREMGFSRGMEMDVMIDKGVEGYKEYLKNPPRPLGTTTTSSTTKKGLTFQEEKAQEEQQVNNKISEFLLAGEIDNNFLEQELNVRKGCFYKQSQDPQFYKRLFTVAQDWIRKGYVELRTDDDIPEDEVPPMADYVKANCDEAVLKARETLSSLGQIDELDAQWYQPPREEDKEAEDKLKQMEKIAFERIKKQYSEELFGDLDVDDDE